jgi:glycosyltransferase involved in cell wall biosynthesis
VNLNRFRPDGPAMPRGISRHRVLTVGRLVERKGFEDVIAAMPRVPGAELVIVGGPDLYADRLRELATRCGVADRVTLAGAVPAEQMPAWYRSADVLAAAPWYEPFGLTPLEAMACGVPVVGTAVGGLIDTVVEGITGDLVPPRDPRTLGLALRRLLADDTRRFSYSVASADRAAHSYSWRRAATQMTALYTTVAGLNLATAETGAVRADTREAVA